MTLIAALASRRLAPHHASRLGAAAFGPAWATTSRACRPFATASGDITGSLKNVGISLTSIKRNPSIDTCYADATKNEPGTHVTSSGALAALSGAKTGRSPSDKRVVDEPAHSSNVWWGPVNIKLPKKSFAANRKKAVDFLNSRDQLYVVDGYAGADPKYQMKIRIICSRAYHALFMHNMLIRPTKEQLETFGEPDFTIFNAGATPADTSVEGVTSKTSVALSFDEKEMVILGTEYAGEMKKGVFTILHYLMPQRDVLSLHTSANEGINAEKDVSFFFGLSGTGKTTLSADPRRRLIGDDEHCWSAKGVFNIEGGCYAKAVDLSAEKEPEIFHAIRKGSVLENVILDPKTKMVDYTKTDITENTRACYPIDFIPNAKIPSVGGHPKNIILLTCDAFGVLPPVAKLTPEQAMYHFISGYTAKIAGTEVGVTEPQATFSACFGQPFLVWHPMKYAEMLAQKLKEHNTNVWLINTGWTGGKYGVGKRIPLKYSRAIIDAIHSGELSKTIETSPQNYPVFNLSIPAGGVKDVPDKILNPADAWADKKAFNKQIEHLAGLFTKNFKSFGSGVDSLKKAGPVL
ncbi:phosphoenolpyruvate carboxykinase (ATP) [Powellomyces hirtus]|uniref:Phosphoenolpyruvate carboxykinase (ATP) n=1 Tax=Powellomyces hirtus TaxID=109895 RepID=A0A507E812_9FUNG|nr:phosphoenolpyruvate carboxykinase (ATP) [Powellomyces hirtus]